MFLSRQPKASSVAAPISEERLLFDRYFVTDALESPWLVQAVEPGSDVMNWFLKTDPTLSWNTRLPPSQPLCWSFYTILKTSDEVIGS